MRFLNSSKFYLTSVVIFSILPLINLLNPGLPIGHDTLDHVARIANFYQNLSEGNVIPRWAGNLNWGFGHPILMFLYPLPSYTASIFHFLGFNLVNSVKIVFALSFVLSGIAAFLWIKEFLSKEAALVGTVLYLFAPYRFIDLYVRGAIGEHTAFIFMPLLLFSIIKLFRQEAKNKLYLNAVFVSISFAGLILSHNAISLIFIPFLLVYVIYLYFENNSKSKLGITILSLALGLALSFFFWFPAFTEGKYTLRDIVTQGSYKESFVSLARLIIPTWSFGINGIFSVQIGIAHLLSIFLSAIYLLKNLGKRDSKTILLIISLLFFVFCVFIMLTSSEFIWQKITILQKLQFTWRFLSLVVLITSLSGAIIAYKINHKYFYVIIITLAIVPTYTFWHAKEYKSFSDSYFFRSYPSTTDTGESAPIWSVRFMENYPSSHIQILSGKATISEGKRTMTKHEYEVDASESTRIRENTLYFPGWEVFDNGKQVENVQFQDPKNRGVITFLLSPGHHEVILKFEETRLRKLADIASFISIISLILFYPIYKWRVK